MRILLVGLLLLSPRGILPQVRAVIPTSASAAAELFHVLLRNVPTRMFPIPDLD